VRNRAEGLGFRARVGIAAGGGDVVRRPCGYDSARELDVMRNEQDDVEGVNKQRQDHEGNDAAGRAPMPCTSPIHRFILHFAKFRTSRKEPYVGAPLSAWLESLEVGMVAAATYSCGSGALGQDV